MPDNSFEADAVKHMHLCSVSSRPRGSREALDVMKRPEYQLVLQFPCSSMEQFDAVVELEEKMIEEFAGSVAEVDGHDAGSDQANIFILTSEPTESFARAHAVIIKNPNLATVLRAAFRQLEEDEYSILWPVGATEFEVA
jgi:hypothetical protein